VEACGTVFMIMVAVLFEHMYHKLLHKAEHSFVYGQSMLSEEEKASTVKRAMWGKPMRLILFARMGGEFMVLGFLAFTIWVFNQQGIFDEIAKTKNTDMRLPTSGSDYLHMMEAVHMQLFVANILYFALALKMVIGADERIKEFEHVRGLWIEQIKGKCDQNFDTDPPALLEFKKWRMHFLDGCVKEILTWQQAQPDIFRNIMVSLNMNKEEGTVELSDLQKCLTGRFSFCTYLVFSVYGSAQGIVSMSQVTMSTIVIIKGFLAIIHRAAHVDLVNLSPWLSGFAFVFIFCLYHTTKAFKRALEFDTIQQVKGFAWLPRFMDKIHGKCDPEEFVITTLQVLLFFLCHSWAGKMIHHTYWSSVFRDGDALEAINAIVYILALCALGVILPRCVPDFAAVMALPPFFSQSNEKIVQLVAVQVMDAKMIAARAQMAEEKQTDAPKAEEDMKEAKDGGDKGEDEKRELKMEAKAIGAPPPKDKQDEVDQKYIRNSNLPLLQFPMPDLPQLEPFPNNVGGPEDASNPKLDGIVSTSVTDVAPEDSGTTPEASSRKVANVKKGFKKAKDKAEVPKKSASSANEGATTLGKTSA